MTAQLDLEKVKLFSEKCQSQFEFNHLLLSLNGSLVTATTEPYDLADPQMLFSMTKSITSLAIGIACDKGMISLEDKIISFFPECLPQVVSPNLEKLTIGHLLMMSPGTSQDGYQTMVSSSNWVKSFFAQEFDCEPGTTFLYSTPSSHLLGAILAVVTKKDLDDFLAETLFYPLGISKPQWEKSPEGITCGGMGLSFPPLALLKIAELVLNQGCYKGQQLISREYLAQATSWQIQKKVNQEKPYSVDGYGYHFHLSQANCYRLDGAFGQLCFISPDNGFILVLFGRGIKNEAVLKLIYEFLFNPQEPLLTVAPRKLVELTPSVGHVGWLLNREFFLTANCLEVRQFKLTKTKTCYRLNLIRPQHGLVIDVDLKGQTTGETWFIKDREEYLQAYVCQSVVTKDKLLVTISFIETPYVVTITISLVNAKVVFSFAINVSFTLSSFTKIANEVLPC